MIMDQIMDTWGYLFTIALLLVLAGVMLYARFSSGATAISLHHQAPGEARFYPTRISTAPVVPMSLPQSEAPLRIDRPSISVAPTPDPKEKDYLDELQEAAAGLAKLMRSSPVTRSEPVLFAPEEAITETEAADPVEIVEEVPLPEVELAVTVVESEAIVTVLEATERPEQEEISAPEQVESPVPLSREQVLGEVTLGQLEKIDSALESLEDLVFSITAGLRELAGSGAESEETELGGAIAAAA